MFIDPLALTARIIEDLESLSVYLEDEVDERTHDPVTLTPEAKRCKEALMTVGVLIPKLRAVQTVQRSQLSPNPSFCANCD